jgi:hypothetical protein
MVEVVGFNVLGWDERAEILGTIPYLRCRECGCEWWGIDERPCHCGEEDEFRGGGA